MRTPRGAAAVVALVVVVLGVVGLTMTLGAGPGFPRLDFSEAEGDSTAVREAVQRSVREGTLAESLAPGVTGAVADELADAPAIFVSASVDPEDPQWPVQATERVLVTNTSSVELAELRLHVLAVEAGGQFEVVDAAIDGDGVSNRVEGSTLVLETTRGLEPGSSVLADVKWKLRPRELVEPTDLNPTDVLNPPQTAAEFSPQLVRQNLLYAFDWYPRPLPLDETGWAPFDPDPKAVDTHGPQTTTMVDLDHPDDWAVAATGARVRQSSGDGRGQARYALAGSRAGAVVVQRHAVERRVTKGDFVATGFGLDRFGPAVADAAVNALYAKAVFAEQAGRTRWRQVSVVGLVFAGESPMFVADDVVFVRQDVLAKGAPARGPNTAESEYRQVTFEGASAEWWGGRVDVDATRHPFLRSGLRRYSAAFVWRALGGDGPAREFTSASARQYRESRSTGTADVAADVPVGVYPGKPQQAIAEAKTTLVTFALASARDGDGPAAFDGARALFEAISDQARLDASALTDAAVAAGIERADASVLVEMWLQGREGDATIGTFDGDGTIPFWTNVTQAVAATGNRTIFPADLASVEGAGPGW